MHQSPAEQSTGSGEPIPFYLQQPDHAEVLPTLENDHTLPAVLFLDNGGDSVKVMYLPSRPANTGASAAAAACPRFLALPNCVGFSPVGGEDIVGAHIQELPHCHGLVVRRPVADGFVVDAGRQAQVWEYILQAFHINAESEARTQVWMTVPHGAPAQVARAIKELLTERFHFHSVVFVSSTFLALLAHEHAAHIDEAQAEASSALAAQHRQPGKGKNLKRSRTTGNDSKGCEGTRTTAPPSPPSARAPRGCGVAIDAGFSGTTVVPYIDYSPVLSSVVRLNVGGKMLTNRLKEHLSFTQTNLLEDGWLVNHIKEQCCVASLGTAVEAARRPPAEVKYYLPTIPALYPLGCREEELDARLGKGPGSGGDARRRHRQRTEAPKDGGSSSEDVDTSSTSGEEEDAGDRHSIPPPSTTTTTAVDRKVLPVLRLGRERSYIPGLLFAPPDTGVHQVGLVQCVLIALCERGLMGLLPLLRSSLAHNIVVFGGSSQFPCFMERLERDLRAALPQHMAQAGEGTHDEDEAAQGSPSPTLRRSRLPTPASTTSSGADNELPRVMGEGIGTVVSGDAALQPLLGATWLLATRAGAQMKERVARRSLCLLQGPHEAFPSELHEAMERML